MSLTETNRNCEALLVLDAQRQRKKDEFRESLKATQKQFQGRNASNVYKKKKNYPTPRYKLTQEKIDEIVAYAKANPHLTYADVARNCKTSQGATYFQIKKNVPEFFGNGIGRPLGSSRVIQLETLEAGEK